MKTLLIRTLVIGGLLAAGPALVLACDHDDRPAGAATRTKASVTATNPSAATARATASIGARWL